MGRSLIIEAICRLHPHCTPEQIAAQLAKVPDDFKLHRLTTEAKA